MSSHPSIDRHPGVASAIGSAPGVPVIRNVNWGGLKTLYVKEVRRFFKVHLQTIWAPALTTLLFLIVFTIATGAKKPVEVGGVVIPFADFIAPGLIISQGMMGPAFANASFSLLVGKIQGTIVDYLQPPLSTAELLTALVGGSMTRAFIVGFICWCAMALYPGVHVTPVHLWAVVWFGFLGAMFLSLLGVLTSIWAEKFDHAAAVQNFVIAPLSLLSGTFYSVDRLAPAFQRVQPRQPVLLHHLGVPLRVPGHRRFAGGDGQRRDPGDRRGAGAAVLHAAAARVATEELDTPHPAYAGVTIRRSTTPTSSCTSASASTAPTTSRGTCGISASARPNTASPSATSRIGRANTASARAFAALSRSGSAAPPRHSSRNRPKISASRMPIWLSHACRSRPSSRNPSPSSSATEAVLSGSTSA